MILKDPKDLLQWFNGCAGCPNDERFSLANIYQAINGTPTIEAEPVRHGRWKLHNDGSGTCDQCHFTQKNVWDFDNCQNYCGVCGAKMDLEGE